MYILKRMLWPSPYSWVRGAMLSTVQRVLAKLVSPMWRTVDRDQQDASLGEGTFHTSSTEDVQGPVCYFAQDLQPQAVLRRRF